MVHETPGIQPEQFPSVDIIAVRQFRHLREQTKIQEQRIREWITQQIPVELLVVPLVDTLAETLVRDGVANFFFTPEIIGRIGELSDIARHLNTLKRHLAPIADVERIPPTVEGNISVGVKLKE